MRLIDSNLDIRGGCLLLYNEIKDLPCVHRDDNALSIKIQAENYFWRLT